MIPSNVFGRPVYILIALLGATFIVAAVWTLQINGRIEVLVWDEAARVAAGADLTACLTDGDLQCSWDWLNRQTFYPFLLPMVHGILMAVGVKPLVASWLPSLLAFAAAGVLIGRIAFVLGMAPATAYLAAVLYWSCPFVVRLAAWGSLESIGACVFLFLVLTMILMERCPSAKMATLAGLIASAAWFLKWDYGIVASASLVVSAAIAFARDHRRDWFACCLVALFISTLAVSAWMSINMSAKLTGMLSFTGQGASKAPSEQDPLFYLFGLFSPEFGLSPLVAALYIAGIAFAGIALTRRQLPSAPLVLIIVALPVYSISGLKNLRYLAPYMPVLALLAAVTFVHLLSLSRLKRTSSWLQTLGPVMLSVWLTYQLVAQITGMEGVHHRFAFLEPNPVAVRTVRFVADTLRGERGPALVVGWTNQLNPFTFRLAWSQALGASAPDVNYFPASLDGVPPSIKFADPGVINIIAIAADRTSTLYDVGDYTRQERLEEALIELQALETSGSLMRLGSLKFDNVTIVTVYRRVTSPPREWLGSEPDW